MQLQNEVLEVTNVVAAQLAKSYRVRVILNAAPARPLGAGLAAKLDLLVVGGSMVEQPRMVSGLVWIGPEQPDLKKCAGPPKRLGIFRYQCEHGFFGLQRGELVIISGLL
jgi:hypothetical protein